MLESIKTTTTSGTSHQDEGTDVNIKSKQEAKLVLHANTITKINSLLHKLNKCTGSTIPSSITTQNSGVKLEQHATGRSSTLKTDTFLEHTLPTTSNLTGREVKHAESKSSAFPVNDAIHSTMMLHSTEAPVFHGKHSESPRPFLLCVREYMKSAHLCDDLSLLNAVSQFLRESALEWYCQLRELHREPRTWREFTEMFLIQFDPTTRRARQEAEWYQCKQKEDETINEFLVRLYALWREYKPDETESNLAEHLLCRMRTDLLKSVKLSRNASLGEIMAEVQQIEDILYRRSRDQQLSRQLKQLSLQENEIYSKDKSAFEWCNCDNLSDMRCTRDTIFLI
ncbi:unnamed protein product [Adineta ricciae]|uniref:Retrotransposon gag domain-containing protein n=1 Tax=Adineta ricciae TaxID=249248 RepID=A0A815W856_ADIRI|nr:unnamed protein product [Adineta ricciae]CAF1538716.1 unnamed protein product [Adineta ricciae]